MMFNAERLRRTPAAWHAIGAGHHLHIEFAS